MKNLLSSRLHWNIVLFLCMILLSLSSCKALKAEEKPNIIVILADDMSPHHPGFNAVHGPNDVPADLEALPPTKSELKRLNSKKKNVPK